MKNAVIFGSSAPVEGDVEYTEAYEIGKLLAENGFVVINGGYMGTMEASSKGAKAGGGKTIGLTVDVLDYVTPNKYLDEEIRTKTLTERIHKGIEIGNVFIILKGSTGTMQEFLEVWHLMELKMIPKRPIICYGNYYQDIVKKLKDTGNNSLVETEDGLIHFAENMDELKRILKPIQ